MLVHIGADKLVREENIVMILDYEQLLASKNGALETMRETCETVMLRGSAIRTVVMVREFGKLKVYFSPVYGKTILKRAE